MLAPGDNVAGYRIDGVLGRGGMGVVYTATQLSLNRTVALKFLADVLGEDPDFRERFRREGLIQAALDHPHIVPVYEAGEIGDGLFLAMRLVRGQNLKELILGGRLDVARTLRVLTPIADALDTAHEAGLIHRDIKPQNILVGARDHAYLADFGLTKEAGATGVTRTGQFVGTFDYVSPELISGHPGDRSSDLYAFAAVLYECLVGRVPYVRHSDAALLYAHVTDPVPRVTELRPDLPESIDFVIGRAMAKDPSERHATATEMVESAAAALAEVIGTAGAPGGPLPPVSSDRRAPTTARGTTRAARPVAPRAAETPRRAAPVAAATLTPPPTDARPAPPETRVGERVAPSPAGGTGVSAGAAEAPPETRVSTRSTEPAVVAPPKTRVSRRGAATPLPAKSRPPAPPETRVSARAVEAPRERAASASPAPPAAAAWRRRAAAGTGAGVVVLAVAAFLVGRSGQEEPASVPQPTVLSGDGVRLTAPANWRRASAPVIPGLDLESPLAIGPNGKAAAVAGIVSDVSGPTLLPAAFVDGLGTPPAADDRVMLGDLEALRFKDLRPQGLTLPVTLFVVPLESGAATVACLAKGCAEVAASLTLPGHKALPVGPSAQLAEDVDAIAGDLEAARRAASSALRKARTRRAQGDALAKLAGAYRASADAVGDLQAGPAERDILTSFGADVDKAADAYADAARAARGGRERSYSQARTKARSGESAMRSSLARLEDAGYRIG